VEKLAYVWQVVPAEGKGEDQCCVDDQEKEKDGGALQRLLENSPEETEVRYGRVGFSV
jgi:hypothetical protein